VANAIEHGSTPDSIVGLSAAEVEDGLAFQVEDSGCFSARASNGETLPERGRGLALIAHLVDEVSVGATGEGTIVRLLKRRAG
jgi:anti-sigma regulatory factor (Ser/Thr protein kinase)